MNESKYEDNEATYFKKNEQLIAIEEIPWWEIGKLLYKPAARINLLFARRNKLVWWSAGHGNPSQIYLAVPEEEKCRCF